jgi:preprotein translocase subunit SecF
MEFFKYSKALGFMAKSRIVITISIILFFASIASLATKGLNYGVDFAGGTIIQVKYNAKAPIDEMREKLKDNALFEGASITEYGSAEEVVIRMRTTTGDVSVDIGDVTRETLKSTGEFEVRRVDIVGPKVGSELKEKGIMSLVLATIGILIYVAFRFEWRFAVASVLALAHDILITIGAVSFFNLEVNLDILAAVLTIIGYSLNDTIIIFDRIRENIIELKDKKLAEIIDESVTKTLSRTTLTSLTTLFVVFTLFVWGGEIIHAFAFTLLVGIGLGTLSSIFVASPILMWLNFDIKNYHAKMAEKAKREAEKERMRSQFESGVI